MADSPPARRTDFGSTVFSYVLPHNREALDYALERLTIDHFRDGIQKTFWTVLADFGERYSDVFPAEHLTELLERHGVDRAKVLLFREVYDSFAATSPAESAFRFAVDGLRDAFDTRATGEVITTTYDILESGVEIDGELLKGHQAARDYYATHIAEIEQRSVVEDAPEGDIRDEAQRLISAYLDREASPDSSGVLWGIDSLDEATGGIQPGEVALIAAYTNEGKSQLLAQLAWDASVMQGRNVFFATSETVRDTTLRRILARHSRLPQFGTPRGLNSKAIQRSTLTADQRETYFDVVRDFTTRERGLCHVSQIPRGATLNFIDQRVSRVNKTHPIDLVCIDYLTLLHAQRPRGSEREDFNEILRNTKVWAPAFDRGRGVAVVSPWQIRQQDYKAALTTNGYTLASLADTSEAEKTPDVIVTLLRPNPNASEANVQVLKNRDGPVLGPSPVHLDYRCSYIGTGAAQPETDPGSVADLNPGFSLDQVLTDAAAGL